MSDILDEWEVTYGVMEEMGGNRGLCSGLAD